MSVSKKGRTGKRKGRKEVNALAEQVIASLRGKMIIHRYDAFSTNSIYLKFDYGVGNSLRISDHNGYEHLSYRYNIILGIDKKYVDATGRYPKEFYPAAMVNEVIERIVNCREEKIKRYKDYNAVVERAKQQPDTTKSFWRCCREIK